MASDRQLVLNVLARLHIPCQVNTSNLHKGQYIFESCVVIIGENNVNRNQSSTCCETNGGKKCKTKTLWFNSYQRNIKAKGLQPGREPGVPTVYTIHADNKIIMKHSLIE